MPSQVSRVSISSFPQLGEQSVSVFALQPRAQHPSSSTHSVIVWKLHAAEQSSALPVRISTVHALPSEQDVGQFPSHFSLTPTTPSPQLVAAISIFCVTTPVFLAGEYRRGKKGDGVHGGRRIPVSTTTRTILSQELLQNPPFLAVAHRVGQG